MSKPTPEQIDLIQDMVAKSWVESCDALSNAELKQLVKEMTTNPELILETQKRLAAADWICFDHGELGFSQTLKDAGMILAAFKIKAEGRKKNETR